MNSHFQNLNTLLAEWQSLQPLKPEDNDRLWRKLRLEWNYHSNHIEGNTLTYGETVLLLLHGQTHGNHTLREYEEMKAHDVGIEHLRNLANDKTRLINAADIRDLNKIILKEPFWKATQTPEGHPSRAQVIPGEYKTLPNSVITASGELFEYASPMEVPARMQELVDALKESLTKRDEHIVKIAAKLHHNFVLIHPFDDGNGRVARMLVNYLLLREGYPPIIVPTEQKKDYLTSLRLADAGEIESLENFFALQTERSLKIAIRAGKGESIEEPSDVEKQVALFIREQKAQTSISDVSTEALQGLMRSSIGPLIEKLEIRMRTLAPLFSRMDVIAIDGNGDVASGLGFVFHGNFEKLGPRRKISFTFIYQSYQETAPSPFDFQTIVEVQFPQDEYIIVQDQSKVVSRPYSKPLLAEEIDQITSGILAKTFDTIRALANPHK